ncbi:MAG TPA: hypothetical protein VLM89_02695 [Phycisphaerae bacterium]|nr:hypothetical protein [Phycisphaerae bacterium]
MIAIMILGIGVVMVATVFPVGLGISRQPIQLYVSMAVADTAKATLMTKVPAYKELDRYSVGAAGPGTHRVLVPDVAATDADAMMDAPKWEVVDNLYVPKAPPPDTIPVSYFHWGPVWQDWATAAPPPWSAPVLLQPAQNEADFISRTKVYTERTGWVCEVQLAAQAALDHPIAGEYQPWQFAYPVEAQNLPAGFIAAGAPNDFLNLVPLMVSPSLTPNAAVLPAPRTDVMRISLADQVYPPVGLNPDYSDRADSDVAAEIMNRRHSWFVFHHPISTERPPPGRLQANRDILATIVTLHRADFGARFARQAKPNPSATGYNMDFDLADDDHKRAMLQPVPDASPATDAVFPRPWLVMLNDLNARSGQARCSPEVARMLPNGSSFVIAQTTLPYAAGTSFQAVRSEYRPQDLGSGVDPLLDAGSFPYVTIEVSRMDQGQAYWVPIWVFPPPIQNAAGARSNPRLHYDFGTRSPVVGVDLRRIPVR